MNTEQALIPEDIGKIATVAIFTRKRSREDEVLLDSLQKYVGKLIGYSSAKDSFTVLLEHMPPISINTRTEHHEFYLAPVSEGAIEDKYALDSIARILSQSDDWGSDEMSAIFHVVDRVRVVDTSTDIMPSARGAFT